MMPWHPRDFSASTQHMLGPERLAFRELLDYQWINGALPSDPKRLAHTLRISESEFLELWPTLKEQFPKDPNNAKGLQNQRLERERLTSIELRTKASAKAKHAADARWPGNASGNASGNATSMPSSSSSSSSDIPIRSESGERVSESAPQEKADGVPPPTRNVQASNRPAGKRKVKESKGQAKKTKYLLQIIAVSESLGDADVARFVQGRYEDVTAEDIHRLRLEHEQRNLRVTVQ
jgi:uncharacterized protein YdaU (DUF1376 family)